MLNIEKLKIPIKAESAEQHGQEVEERLQIVQLLYADKLCSNQKTEFPQFYYALSGYTNLLFDYEKGLKKLAELKIKKPEDLRLDLKKEIEEINEKKEADWENKILALIKEETDKVWVLIEETDENIDQQHLGLLSYGPKKALGDSMEKFGLKEGDEFIDIHFDYAFKKEYGEGEKFSHRNIIRWLRQLAEVISRKLPNSKAVIGKSWLMNYARELGFTVDESESTSNGMDAWIQFIDSKGQINEEKVKELLETGELPDKSVCGYMKMEDFYKKYKDKLKDETIEVKYINPEWKKINDSFGKCVHELEKNWDNLTVAEMVAIFNPTPELTDLLKSDAGKNLFLFFKKMKEKGVTIADLKAQTDAPEAQKIKEEIRKYLEQNKFIVEKIEL